MQEVIDSMLSVFDVTAAQLVESIITILNVALPVTCAVLVVKIGIRIFQLMTGK